MMGNRKLLKTRKYKAGYEVRYEAFSGPEYGVPDDEPFVMTSAFTPEGHYIGRPVDAYRLIVKRGIKPEARTEHSSNCSIGFCEREQKWYGWSHRMMCGFGIGDRIFEETYSALGDTPPSLHGDIVISTLEQARQAAMNFAEYVS